MVATYRFDCGTSAEAADLARAIAREQTVEVPPGVGGDALQARMLGRVEHLVPAPGSGREAGSGPGDLRFEARIAYPRDATGTDLAQILNVAYGNVALMEGVRLVGLDLSPELLGALPGPRFGIAGIRALAGAERRPLVATAIKPLGLSTGELASLAAILARAGIDFVKDDHGLADQTSAPFAERVSAVADAVADANAATGGRTVYLPNVTGASEGLDERLGLVASAGLSGVLLCPGLSGLDTVRSIAAGPRDLAVMAHPSHAGSAPGRREGIAPHVLHGTLYRVAGADMVIFPDAGGRHGWPDAACREVAERLRSSLGPVAPALPTPAGGMKIDGVAAAVARYGPDAMLLIGGSLLMKKDLKGAARRLVESVAVVADVEGTNAMKVDGVPYRAIFTEGDGTEVRVIDQTVLPHRFETIRLEVTADAARAIREMVVRGAPLIGATAAYGVALAMRRDPSDESLEEAVASLAATRPTAVNLRWALDGVGSLLGGMPPGERVGAAYDFAARLCEDDVRINRGIGEFGLEIFREVARRAGARGRRELNVMTHCNAGWLATVDWGTATAPVYLAHDRGLPVHVWVRETRPRLQGAALTAWELGRHGVPHTLVSDSAAGHLLGRGKVDVVIVGTDRTTAAGDVANKVGTYPLALAARDNGVPFYVAVPSPSVDWSIEDGAEIPIEERDAEEVTRVWGVDADGVERWVRIVPEGTRAANYAFDVTPRRLVTGMVTERGVCGAEGLRGLFGR